MKVIIFLALCITTLAFENINYQAISFVITMLYTGIAFRKEIKNEIDYLFE